MIPVAILGATGYSGVELVRLLLQHPSVELSYLTSDSYTGQQLSAVYPHLATHCDRELEKVDVGAIARRAKAVFLALPSGFSSQLVPELLEAGLQVIDLAGDFRLSDPEIHEQWYGKAAPSRIIQAQAVYGIPELWPEEIRRARLIANPGCYPTSAILGLAPLIRENLIDLNSIIIDAKSGVSGAGRGASLGVHFSEVNENFKAYKVGSHQHTPEIEAAIAHLNGGTLPAISFTAHLLPVTRGILSTMYATLRSRVTSEQITDLYRSAYDGKPCIRIMPTGQFPSIKQVTGSNHCDIGCWVDERTQRITVISAIDNLLKGAAGQAIQNFNLMNGFDEMTALEVAPTYP